MESQDKIEVNYYPISMEESSSTGTAEKPASNTPAVALPSSNILQSSVGSVMVDNAIQSGNFAKGASGWKLDSDGNLEANNGNFRGDITGASGTFSGTVTVNEINIGGDDATSAHIDSDGNFWTGASVANKAIAPARINKDGTAYFTGVTTMGAVADEFTQITWDSTNLKVNGSFIKNEDAFGDGSDGNVTISGDTTLTTDMFYDNLTVNTTKTLNTGGFRIFVKGTLTVSGSINRNGNAGTAGGNGGNSSFGVTGAGGSAGTAGVALADGSIKGALVGVDGVVGAAGKAAQYGGGGAGNSTINGNNGTAGLNGANTAKSLVNYDGIAGVNSVASGTGTANGFTGNSGATAVGGTAGTRTGTVYNKVHNQNSAYRLYDDNGTAFLTPAPSNGNSASAPSAGVSVYSAGAGGSVNATSGGSGGIGGSGSMGGIVFISARKIIVNVGGSIQANGGASGNSGNSGASYAALNAAGPTDWSAAAGGTSGSPGANGGNGGVLIICYSSITNNGTIQAIAGTSGTGGTAGAKATAVGGTGTASATDGTNGTDGTGNAGALIYLQV